jgi:hypothetical protein
MTPSLRVLYSIALEQSKTGAATSDFRNTDEPGHATRPDHTESRAASNNIVSHQIPQTDVLKPSSDFDVTADMTPSSIFDGSSSVTASNDVRGSISLINSNRFLSTATVSDSNVFRASHIQKPSANAADSTAADDDSAVPNHSHSFVASNNIVSYQIPQTDVLKPSSDFDVADMTPSSIIGGSSIVTASNDVQ